MTIHNNKKIKKHKEKLKLWNTKHMGKIIKNIMQQKNKYWKKNYKENQTKKIKLLKEKTY